MLNVQMYTQMGYTQAQVLKAYDYSQKKGVDMFDALQLLQNKDYVEGEKKYQNNVPAFSFLNNIKNINLNQYEIIYSRYGVKQNNYNRDQLRQPNTPVGLLNVSNCCYLNSLLQCYFLMGSFTREILSAEEIQQLPQHTGNKAKRIKNQYLLLSALKQIFAKMRLSSRRYLNPTPVLKNLVNSLGQKIQYGDEKDLNQINMEIVERLSECLIYTKKYYSKGEASPSKIKKKQNIKNLFYGQKVQTIEQVQGQTVVDFMGIILNPKHDNIISALDEQFNYDVEIDGKIMKRHTFIRVLPKYLFLSINRAQFEKNANQLLKNSQKISFDFVIYLDQYLQVNKEQAKLKNPKIKQLQNKKSIIKTQLNHLNILDQKIQQCRIHAKYLVGWQQKFPKHEEIQQQKNSFKKKLELIQQELAQIQSRKQKFVLMYLFVHRGDAISGHYWGYGRNGNYWYRFDINCTSIKQSDILVDIQKSGGTPYALVYAKDNQISCFAYPYHTFAQNVEFFAQMSSSNVQDYTQLIPVRLKKQIIDQNIAMHTSIQKQKTKNSVENIIKDYKAKYNIVKSEVEKYLKNQNNINIPLYSNLACYLQSIKQVDLMKFNIFSTALFSKAEVNCAELLEKQHLLKSIQKAFKKKVKGKMSLRHFAIQCQPVEGSRYKQKAAQYVVGKKCLQFIRLTYLGIKQWPKINKLNDMIEDICRVFQTTAPISVYIKSITTQLVAIMLIDLAKRGQGVKLSWSKACNRHNQLLNEQVQRLCKQKIPQNQNFSSTSISQIQLQQGWNLENLKKGFQNETMNAVRQIISKLGDGYDIYRTNTKEKKLVGDVPKKQVINQDLI